MGVIKWTDESKAIVRRLWVQEGLAASVIAARLAHALGRPVTRNAIIGIAHRSGWALGGVERVRRQAANKGNGIRRKKRKLTPAAQKPASPLAKLMAEPWTPRPLPAVPKARQRSLIDLADDQCRWPCTDAPPHLFCAGPRVPGASYCPDHLVAAHSNQPIRGHGLRPDFARTIAVNVSKKLAANGFDPTAHVYPVDARTLEVIE
jgi:hypothetical protein